MKSELYFVALLPDKLLEKLNQYQKQLSVIFELYDEYYPVLHITLAKLFYDEEGQIPLLVKNLQEMLSHCHSPTIYIDGVSCFGPPYKSVNIHVCSTPYLQQFSQSIHQAAVQAGMDYENFGGQWQYHISLANSAFAKREWTDTEYCLACNILKRMDFNAHFQIEQMQLWYPRKHDYVIHTFPLKG